MSALSEASPQYGAPGYDTPAAHQADTGVFCSHASATAATSSLPADKAATGPTCDLPSSMQRQQARQQAATAGRQNHQECFQYPEDIPAAVTQPKRQHQQQQSVPTQQRTGRGAVSQAAAYSVEEPDSPAQASSALQHHEQHTAPGTRADGDSDPPAGCLYQDTTIRRTTTPLRNGKPTGAWSHHEEITVRQVQIKQSEARMHHAPALHQPHVMQGGR